MCSISYVCHGQKVSRGGLCARDFPHLGWIRRSDPCGSQDSFTILNIRETQSPLFSYVSCIYY